MMKTIDERIDDLVPQLFDGDVNLSDVRESLREALLEVARDQRHACAESLTRCRKLVMGSKQRVFIEFDDAHQAVMNAEIGK